MTVPKGSQFEDVARAAARNIDAAAAAGDQLSFLPDEADGLPVAAGEGARAPRGKGRATSQLRDWLAARGMRLPEQVLAEMAGLATREDVFLYAMRRCEQVLAWAEAGATPAKGAPGKATLGQRLQAFQVIYATAVRAAEALLPYGLAKVTPEDAPQAAVQVFVAPGGSAQVRQDGADRARDVTPQPGRLAPPPLPSEMQQNQQVAQPVRRAVDAVDRTE